MSLLFFICLTHPYKDFFQRDIRFGVCAVGSIGPYNYALNPKIGSNFNNILHHYCPVNKDIKVRKG